MKDKKFKQSYIYAVKEITKVYDGDTITVILDLGFGVFRKDKIRLANINTPELRGIERIRGLESRNYLRNRLYSAIENGTPIFIKTAKDKKGKYGRYIGEVFIDGISINDELVNRGLAEYKAY